MVIDYIVREKQLYENLLDLLSENKIIDLEVSEITKQFDTTSININCHPSLPIWFYRFEHSSEIIYYFGIKDETDVKLVLNVNSKTANSIFKFFNPNLTGIEIKFSGDILKNYYFLKENFTLKSPSSNKNKYYLILSDGNPNEIILTIFKFINMLHFKSDLNNGFVTINDYNAETEELTEILEVEDNVESEDIEKNPFVLEDDLDDNNLDGDNEINLSKFTFTNDSVIEVISQIDLTKFIQEPYEDDLVEELNEFKILPIFKYLTNDFSDFETTTLMNKIEEDITSKKISGEVIDIINFYFDEYKIIKRHYVLNCSLDDAMNNEEFNNLFYLYSKEVISKIIDHIRQDIHNDNIMDEETLILKLKNYVKQESAKKELYKELKEHEKRIPVISIRYNLDKLEILDIFHLIKNDIENDKIEIYSLKEYLDKKLDDKVELNKSKSRMKLNNVLKTEIIKDKISDDEELLDYLNNNVGGLIDSNKLKSEEITEKFIINEISKFEGD